MSSREGIDVGRLIGSWRARAYNEGLDDREAPVDNVLMIQDMMCSQNNAPCSHINPRKYKNILNTAMSPEYFFIKRITVTFMVADGPSTSINQTCAPILAAVYVLLGRAITEYRWGGSRNTLFMRHKFLVLTVKKWLKSVYIYGSYRKIKTGVSRFWTTRYIWLEQSATDWVCINVASLSGPIVSVHFTRFTA